MWHGEHQPKSLSKISKCHKNEQWSAWMVLQQWWSFCSRMERQETSFSSHKFHRSWASNSGELKIKGWDNTTDHMSWTNKYLQHEYELCWSFWSTHLFMRSTGKVRSGGIAFSFSSWMLRSSMHLSFISSLLTLQWNWKISGVKSQLDL